MRFAIRAYRPEDFQRLWEIDQSCFPPGISYSQAELKSYIRRASAFTLVAELVPEHDEVDVSPEPANLKPSRESGTDRRIAGFLVGERSRGRGHIITIDVREAARRWGIGSTLLDSAEARFRSLACASIRLETAVDNRGALLFYKKHGYSVIGTIPRYYSNEVDALLLEKILPAPA